MPTTRSYQDYLIQSLRDPQEAAAYLDAVLEDGTLDELRLALNNVAEAQRDRLNMTPSQIELLQQTLAPQSQLDLFVVLQLLDELGFKLSIQIKDKVA